VGMRVFHGRHHHPLPHANAHAMIRRHQDPGRQSHLERRHAAYLKNGGSLKNAAAMATHASTRTTQNREGAAACRSPLCFLKSTLAFPNSLAAGRPRGPGAGVGGCPTRLLRTHVAQWRMWL
jgi:hypothetical protein